MSKLREISNSRPKDENNLLPSVFLNLNIGQSTVLQDRNEILNSTDHSVDFQSDIRVPTDVALGVGLCEWFRDNQLRPVSTINEVALKRRHV